MREIVRRTMGAQVTQDTLLTSSLAVRSAACAASEVKRAAAKMKAARIEGVMIEVSRKNQAPISSGAT
ncbi:hypothetical protein [Brevundimonas sp.]|jgi:hypothetical protein|uniref:hypothetical protein n=1 Tax=Brevundimonas sp. TaxID=1871086 RepID=UPI0025B8C331|nr:hypothetical protein [Brevundimonas sp.]